MSKDRIDEVLYNFDFGKVHRAMIALDWQWDVAGGVPSYGRLVDAARKLLEYVVDNSERITSAATGGFIAEIYEDGSLGLSFCIDSYTSIEES